MSVRGRLHELVSAGDVKPFLECFPTAILFKAGSCHKTMQAFGHIEQILKQRPDLHVGFIRENRSKVSERIVKLTEVAHEVPQIILIVHKKPVFDLDNWDITVESLEEGLAEFLGPVEAGLEDCEISSDLNRYIELLKGLLGGDMCEDDFEVNWLSTFQSDVTLRSYEEFDLLNSLYGDVNEVMAMRLFPAGTGSCGRTRKTLAEKALQLLAALNARTALQ